MKSFLIKTVSVLVLTWSAAFAAQPPITIPVVNGPCQTGPKMVGGQPEVVGTPLDSGFVSLFNGKDLTGWWENCQTHTTDTKLGGVWIVDPSSGILYSREEGQNGNILVTNQNFDNYEFIVDVWPTYGNDGGIFNRVTASGKTWQTTVDYIQGSGVAGSYNEKEWAGPTNINDDPIRFGAGGQSLPDVPNGTWTTFTKTQDPLSFGCSANGCVGSDFAKIWNVDGWNQIRVKFYDGLVPGKSVRMETWIRKVAVPEVPWVPVYKEQKAIVTPAGPVALQIHGGGRWKAGSYNLYKNMKIRQLNVDGTVPPPTGTRMDRSEANGLTPNLKLVGGMITGELDGAYEVTLTDVRGRLLERFSAGKGLMRHGLTAGSPGIIIAQLSNNRGTMRVCLSRI
jgi:hypothetical protein